MCSAHAPREMKALLLSLLHESQCFRLEVVECAPHMLHVG